jgi:hypothetical protein
MHGIFEQAEGIKLPFVLCEINSLTEIKNFANRPSDPPAEIKKFLAVIA